MLPRSLHILWVGGVDKDLPVIPAPPSCPPSQCLGVPSGGELYILCLLLEKETERREQEERREEGRTASQLTTWRAFCFVGASVTQIPAPHPKPGNGSGMDMSEPEQLPSVLGGRVCLGGPLPLLRLLPSSAAQGWAGLISWPWLLGSCSLVEST